jgi:hypothetical protein
MIKKFKNNHKKTWKSEKKLYIGRNIKIKQNEIQRND